MSTTRYIVDNQSGQTINGETVLRPYKVYTALLTQSGGDNQVSLIDEPLTIGVTYKIGDQAGGTWDFTNVGAPNNDIDTYFVATGTTPNSWGNGTLIYNEGAPVVVTVLENTIGNVWFVFLNDGQYTINCDLFIDNIEKLFLQSGKPNNSSSDVFGYVDLFQLEGLSVYMTTKDFDTNTLSNGVLSITPIEIRVYD